MFGKFLISSKEFDNIDTCWDLNLVDSVDISYLWSGDLNCSANYLPCPSPRCYRSSSCIRWGPVQVHQECWSWIFTLPLLDRCLDCDHRHCLCRISRLSLSQTFHQIHQGYFCWICCNGVYLRSSFADFWCKFAMQSFIWRHVWWLK